MKRILSMVMVLMLLVGMSGLYADPVFDETGRTVDLENEFFMTHWKYSKGVDRVGDDFDAYDISNYEDVLDDAGNFEWSNFDVGKGKKTKSDYLLLNVTAYSENLIDFVALADLEGIEDMSEMPLYKAVITVKFRPVIIDEEVEGWEIFHAQGKLYILDDVQDYVTYPEGEPIYEYVEDLSMIIDDIFEDVMNEPNGFGNLMVIDNLED
ncbi:MULTISPECIES: hypothetical protein [unclassified Fusibacter]|uniref:hypothetical protein n=1 Tax=unclassified Fusibacter TaxID=2624464 RepID=UPI001011E74B|nr:MULTISPECIES: hypothetical protein [unclassified Fusibacter]MCK8059674.1 hypothetical protein [Fusibacter sp. A2]NPE21475.1 hypothetical protein [Fusibacter sp. A1]RXV61886.1 hypothetical protein DWB64_06510 [Fusibacter sp. A1]